MYEKNIVRYYRNLPFYRFFLNWTNLIFIHTYIKIPIGKVTRKMLLNNSTPIPPMLSICILVLYLVTFIWSIWMTLQKITSYSFVHYFFAMFIWLVGTCTMYMCTSLRGARTHDMTQILPCNFFSVLLSYIDRCA